MRAAIKTEDGKKIYVLLTDEDRKDERITRTENGRRVLFNTESLELLPHGLLSKGDGHDNFTLYPWEQVLWVDSNDPADLR